ncbi:MAG: Ppx/GppA family phosphatase [Alphaproteobacteria bacterium]|nr:Ppx/GppA family phosphatase [Alphaproteobacteria bacterium]
MALNLTATDIRPAAVVDIGSNSIRLVVFRDRSRAPVAVFNERVICGIGRGLARTGRLHAEGVEQALANLPRFAAITSSMGIKDAALLATAATREAEDGPAFLKKVEKLFDRPITQLDGDSEAELAAAGVLCGLPDARGLAADLGGGSLELAALAKGKVGDLATLPLGPLRLLATVGHDRKSILDTVDKALSEVTWASDAVDKGAIYIVGGAWRALARLHMVQSAYPLRVIHNYRIGGREAGEFCEVVAGLGESTLSRIDVVPKARAATLPVAASVLQRLIAHTGARQVVFSALGIREGKVYQELGKKERAVDPLIAACEDVALRESRFARMGRSVFDWIAPLFPDEDAADERLRLAACLLSDIGWHEHPDYRAEQVYFRILRLPLLAMTHEEKTRVALAVYRRYGGSMNDQALRAAEALLDEDDMTWGRQVGAALRFTETLTAGNSDLLDGIQLRMNGKTVTLKLKNGHTALVGDVVRNRFAALARQFGKEPVLEGKGL